jgi:hypothetical protein
MKKLPEGNEVNTEEQTDMVRITMDSGLELEIDRNFMNDMELLDMMVDADEGNALVFSAICGKILDKESKKKLYDSLRDKSGRVKTTDVVPALMEIIQKTGEAGKNL